MPTIILAPTTATGYSDWVVVEHQTEAHFKAPGLAGSETGVLQCMAYDESAYDVYETDIVALNTTRTDLHVISPGKYRIHKSATAASVGVEVSTSGNP